MVSCPGKIWRTVPFKLKEKRPQAYNEISCIVTESTQIYGGVTIESKDVRS